MVIGWRKRSEEHKKCEGLEWPSGYPMRHMPIADVVVVAPFIQSHSSPTFALAPGGHDPGVSAFVCVGNSGGEAGFEKLGVLGCAVGEFRN